MISKLNSKAIVYGVITYPIVYVAYVAFLNVLLPDDPGPYIDWIYALFNIVSWIGLLLPGYFAGRIAQEKGILHGFVVGILAGAGSSAFFAFVLSEQWLGESAVLNIVYYMTFITFTASVGGGLGQLHAKYRLAA
ncbi:MAG: hypothetical protein JAY85_08615 [Candidatus Thiodiazotropha weberae]|nr:hypothetical protein [Candidatus Thiodiazotropha endoloripes]MCG7898507.1 hypothetical protein [Candidatus Thiodiazotropha weberae]